ncbi:MAG: hypothetical protein K1X38_14010 [Microthrixaceae bacterium]|nr:hypothetical protein [Microthrixaceae bacterium]
MDPAEREERARFLESRLDGQDATHPGWKDAWLGFAPILLAHGGALAVPPPEPDPLLGMIQEQGKVYAPSYVIYVGGDASECHRNVAALWRSGQATFIGTGYALSDDELWREHSWAWDDEGHLLETTTARSCYFGLRFEQENCQRFVDWVDPR